MPSMTTNRAPGMAAATPRPLRGRTIGSREPCSTTVGAVIALLYGQQAAGAQHGVELAQHAGRVVGPLGELLDALAQLAPRAAGSWGR